MGGAGLARKKPVLVVLAETRAGTHYQLKAYPFDMRDQFRLVSDLTVRGKRTLAEVGAVAVVSSGGGGGGSGRVTSHRRPRLGGRQDLLHQVHVVVVHVAVEVQVARAEVDPRRRRLRRLVDEPQVPGVDHAVAG